MSGQRQTSNRSEVWLTLDRISSDLSRPRGSLLNRSKLNSEQQYCSELNSNSRELPSRAGQGTAKQEIQKNE